jgi:pimeloyl-ACP methyl ester carboxylesterase
LGFSTVGNEYLIEGKVFFMPPSKLPLMFIHGAGGTSSKWRRVRDRLGDRAGIYVDLPGHGAGGDDTQDSVEGYAAVLGPQIHQEVVLVGHSMGGLIAMELAVRHHFVKGLVLVASHMSLPVHPKILVQLSAGVFPESLFHASYSKQVDAKLLMEERDEIALVSTQTTFLDFDACNGYHRGPNVFAALDIPILAVYGSEDRLLPPTAKEDLVKVNARASVTTVAASGHYVMLEQPDEFVHVLTDFQGRVSESQA